MGWLERRVRGWTMEWLLMTNSPDVCLMGGDADHVGVLRRNVLVVAVRRGYLARDTGNSVRKHPSLTPPAAFPCSRLLAFVGSLNNFLCLFVTESSGFTTGALSGHCWRRRAKEEQPHRAITERPATFITLSGRHNSRIRRFY